MGPATLFSALTLSYFTYIHQLDFSLNYHYWLIFFLPSLFDAPLSKNSLKHITQTNTKQQIIIHCICKTLKFKNLFYIIPLILCLLVMFLIIKAIEVQWESQNERLSCDKLTLDSNMPRYIQMPNRAYPLWGLIMGWLADSNLSCNNWIN